MGRGNSTPMGSPGMPVLADNTMAPGGPPTLQHGTPPPAGVGFPAGPAPQFQTPPPMAPQPGGPIGFNPPPGWGAPATPPGLGPEFQPPSWLTNPMTPPPVPPPHLAGARPGGQAVVRPPMPGGPPMAAPGQPQRQPLPVEAPLNSTQVVAQQQAWLDEYKNGTMSAPEYLERAGALQSRFEGGQPTPPPMAPPPPAMGGKGGQLRDQLAARGRGGAPPAMGGKGGQGPRPPVLEGAPSMPSPRPQPRRVRGRRRRGGRRGAGVRNQSPGRFSRR
ncbi:hypothetical protein CMI37_28355 [Candidatus Pacearchaeota archaeon]|nr:hypothetical protein [Candidatus Pacearchaeota archaeon]